MNILAVGCHPDDLEINCGGTLARYAQEGHAVTMLHIANGNMGHVVIMPDELRAIRGEEAQRAGEILGAKEVISLDVPDLQLGTRREIELPVAFDQHRLGNFRRRRWFLGGQRGLG